MEGTSYPRIEKRRKEKKRPPDYDPKEFGPKGYKKQKRAEKKLNNI